MAAFCAVMALDLKTGAAKWQYKAGPIKAAPAYYGGYYGDPYYPVVRYRRVIRPAYAYYGGPRFYGPRYYGGYWRRW